MRRVGSSFGGAAASGLPLPGNPLGGDSETQTSLQPFGLGTNEGGAYLWVVDNDMSTRLFVGRLSAGTTRARARAYPYRRNGAACCLGRPRRTLTPDVCAQCRPTPAGYGTDDGFFAVLGGDPLEQGGGRFSL